MSDQEPVVSVRNIPQSQYDSQQGMQTGGGGIRGHLQRNWPIYAVGIGILTIAVMIYLNYRNGGSGATTSSPSATTDSGSTWGAQLDSDYQQMISNQNQTVGLLQQLLNQGKSGNGGTTTPPSPGPPSPGPNNPPSPPQSPQYYSVVSGDTLSHIADTHGFASWQSLYNFGGNTQTVMNTAKQHGITHDYQNWIYPGEQIQVK